MRQLLSFLLASTLILTSCVSTEKLVDQGNYDQAIDIAIRKLAGKKNKKVDHVVALEEAFAKITANDLDRANRLKLDGREANWDAIYSIYRNMRIRQEKIEPLLPVVDKHGVKANFKFVNTLPLEKEAKENAANYYYDRAQQALAQARRGDKLAARTAFEDLQKINRYYRSFKNKYALQQEAKELGIAHILVRTKNEAPVIMPRMFERELMDFGMNKLNGRWRTFHTTTHSDIDFDYEVVVSITSVEVSPALVQEKIYQDTKEIEDGFDYVLDENGNVMKDTLGNDIKIPRKIIITADVVEAFQSKAAKVDGYLEFFDLKTRRLIESKPFGGEAIFEHYASTFDGDRRALSDHSRKYCDIAPLPFPTNEALILEAASHIKPVIRKQLTNTNVFL